MSHVFSSQDQDPGPQRLSVEEAKELIRTYQHREAALDSQVTVQDMAETLGLPTWQVANMVQELRAKQLGGRTPMPAGEWLKKRFWIWALVAAMIMGGRGIFLSRSFNIPTIHLPTRANRVASDGIYDHAPVVQGRAFGMQSPPGFSYEILYGTVEAAANGDSKHYVPADELSPENTAIVQEQYAQAIADGLSKAVAKSPPQWVNGEAAGIVKPNYYDAGTPKPIDIPLKQNEFPYGPNNPASKELHDEILKGIKNHWEDILSDN